MSRFEAEDRRTTPVPGPVVSGGAIGVGGGFGSSYTGMGAPGAGGSFATESGGGLGSSYGNPAADRPQESFDFGDTPIRSAAVPSLAGYLNGMSGSASQEFRIKQALADSPPPPAPEPVTIEPEPYEDDSPFRPLNLDKLPEPVFAFRTEPEPAAMPEKEDEPEAQDIPVSELADTGEYEDPVLDAYDGPAEEEFVDDKSLELDSDSYEEAAVAPAAVSESGSGDPFIVGGDEDDSASGLVEYDSSDRGELLMSNFDSLPDVVDVSDQATFDDSFAKPASERGSVVIDDSDRGDLLMPDLDSPSDSVLSSALLEDDDSDRGDFLMPDFGSSPDSETSGFARDEDGFDRGDSIVSDFGSSSTIVDVSDQASFDGSITEFESVSDSESPEALIEESDSDRGDYPDDFDSPSPEPASHQPFTQFKTNKYWAMDSDISPQESVGTDARPTSVNVPVTPAWRKPSIRMLNTAQSNAITEQEQQVTAEAITRTLGDYGIEVGVKHIRPGPTVTMYGLTPGWVRKSKTVKQVDDEGLPLKDERGRLITKQVEEKTRVKVDSILAREKDLSLALKTPSIRLETPVMGKSLIGIEVPNPNPSLVTLRSIMEGPEFQKMRDGGAHLPVALGQGSGGESVVFDLAKMPHLLVAGATGSGKSVCLNAIVSCLITEKTPAELRMILVDPKRVELTPYNGIPHLLAPVIVETDTVVGYLKGMIREMFDRYRRMEEVGVRNIEAYNNRMPDKMPLLCIVIDELADLMMTAAVDVEQSICRLAQLGRATGIHMIIATQRPSVDVLTGLIKANFPSRISFGVTSQIDSRTILDTGGADKLLGRGDMLYLPLDASKPSRVQSVFIGDSEIEKLVSFWKSAPRLPLDEIDLLGGDDVETSDGPEHDPDRDEMIDKAIEIAISHRKLSTSLLQRRLRIGYPRAARLMDQLEEEGIVGPGDGSKSRDVIINQN